MLDDLQDVPVLVLRPRVRLVRAGVSQGVVVDGIDVTAAGDDQGVDHVEQRRGIVGIDDRAAAPATPPALRTAFTYGALTT